MKKLVSIVLALAMIMMVSVAFAQEKEVGGGTASITIENAAKGETYSIVKLFDATVGNGAIAYQSTAAIPTALANFFEKDSANNVTLKRIADENGKNPGDEDYIDTFYTLTDDDFKTMKTWAASQTATATEASDGSPLKFTKLPYGYYIVISSQGAAVTVDSTNPNAVIRDKNTKIITANKEADGVSYSVGDTITYTASFDTANYYGAGENAKVVTKYDIVDTLPEYLSDIEITSVLIKNGDTVEADLSDDYSAFDSTKKITIDWADKNATTGEWTSRYNNGVKIVVTYTAVLTSVTNINAADTNTVSIHPHVGDNDEQPWEDDWQDEEEIFTYAAALKKVDATDHTKTLADATFTIKGLTVTDGQNPGEYIVVSYDPDSDTQSATLSTNEDGVLYIIGLASNVDMTVTEVKAPDGYNKLTAPVSGFTPQVMDHQIFQKSGTIKYDAKGNVIESSATATTTKERVNNLEDLTENPFLIENNKGTELPSTGGIGTTIFYILGGLLVIGAAVILVARRKAQD